MSGLARQITRTASLQTYHTIALLVDQRRRDNAYRAYAYFRWLDDLLDGTQHPADERQRFVERQRMLLQSCLAAIPPDRVTDEEQMLVELVRSDPDPCGPLSAYLHNMMSVMLFDASRRDRLISQAELAAYQRSLAVAVTEALYYFIDGGDSGPRMPERYSSVTAAHITHVLRDTHDDLRSGYFNVPLEFLHQHHIGPEDVDSPAFRQWVELRVQLAREHFRLGRRYLHSAGSARCRLAAASYAARFECVLDLIERDGFRVRPSYEASGTISAGLRIAASVLLSALRPHPRDHLYDGAGPHKASGTE